MPTAADPRAVPAREAAARLPAEPGVYRFRDERGRALYVGRAVNLRRRALSYWSDLDDRPHLRRMMPRVTRVEAVVCASDHEAAWLERTVLERRLPPWNRTAGGQETPVYLRLDASATAPGLRVAYTPAAGGFGPYLGGTKVRAAIAGLHRVFPLPYAADALTSAERDLARVREVTPGSREQLAAALAAVLARDPDAVRLLRAELIARRDEAARRTAYEHAARVQTEIEAVDWVVATQRVTGYADRDLDFHGWAAGRLVRFEIRAGRLDGWQVRPCSAAAAAARVAATPAEWTAFATHNAELAAALS
ncbi:hypothetical protein AB0M47_21700 [Hamadaea sp. NPDC051192]|uniref:hypothetical protein n=1 Tax=Hamadaea sp. NPDC051192 TaxID=3154940 RepID=UPI00341706C2